MLHVFLKLRKFDMYASNGDFLCGIEFVPRISVSQSNSLEDLPLPVQVRKIFASNNNV
jgi:hypothetical protein